MVFAVEIISFDSNLLLYNFPSVRDLYSRQSGRKLWHPTLRIGDVGGLLFRTAIVAETFMTPLFFESDLSVLNMFRRTFYVTGFTLPISDPFISWHRRSYKLFSDFVFLQALFASTYSACKLFLSIYFNCEGGLGPTSPFFELVSPSVGILFIHNCSSDYVYVFH